MTGDLAEFLSSQRLRATSVYMTCLHATGSLPSFLGSSLASFPWSGLIRVGRVLNKPTQAGDTLFSISPTPLQSDRSHGGNKFLEVLLFWLFLICFCQLNICPGVCFIKDIHDGLPHRETCSFYETGPCSRRNMMLTVCECGKRF